MLNLEANLFFKELGTQSKRDGTNQVPFAGKLNFFSAYIVIQLLGQRE